METIKVKAKAIKETFANGDYRIFSWMPLQTYENIQLSPYMTFSTKGETPYITENKEYELELELIKHDPKWGDSFRIIDVPSMRLEELNDENELKILKEITTESQANYVHNAYPNFIRLILNGEEDKIDLNKIYNVAEYRFNAYKREINTKYKYFGLVQKLKEYRVDISDCKKLYDKYEEEFKIQKAIKENPYYVLTEVLERSFNKADKLILELFPNLIDSRIRCEALMLDVLKRNETDSNTRLNGNLLWQICKEDYNAPDEWAYVIKDIATNSDLIYYDEESKDLSIMNTYVGESLIANFVKEKIYNSKKLNINWNNYKNIDGFELTNEQLKALENACNYNFSLLIGYSGCVDKDTEFFNGKSWKKISEYNKNDMVLQWNLDGTTNLVKPQRYIKLPCNKMYHFETKYGINQTLSPEHRVVYINEKTKKIEEKTMQEIYDRHYSKNHKTGFNGNFITTFNYNGKGIDLTDEEIKLMCAVICDGTFYYNVTNTESVSYKTCRFHIKKERKKSALRNLFKEANIEWREKESTKIGYTDFYITAPRREKEFTEYWYNCSQHQLQIICDNLMQWDGNTNITKNGIERKRFSTNVLSTANFVQFAYSACGYRASIYINDRRGRIKTNKETNKKYINKTIEYNISITKQTLCKLSYLNDKKHKKTEISEIIPKDGYKYCFTVPSSYLVLRRNNNIFITGNCGKTSSLKGLIAMLEDNRLTYTLLAPTGAASMRITEQTNRPASTIHRKCLRDKEIWSDFIIVDEASMVDLDTMVMLINCIKNDEARVILCGDNAQLLPVGKGNVFNDIISCNYVPRTMLTKVFRYDTNGALFVATNIRKGKSFFNDTEKVKVKDNIYSVENNYKFIQIEEDKIFDELRTQYDNLLNKGIKPKDIMILCPFNVGSCGNYKINNEIQAEVNAPKPNEKIFSREVNGTNIVFREDSRVINKKNDYNALLLESYELIQNDELGLLKEEDIPHTQIFNGQKGIVRNVDDKKMVVQFDEELIVFDKIKVNNLLLSYSQSTHSSQGSEAKYVISIVNPIHKKMLNRNLLYVADTRAKILHIDIGDINTFNNALLIDGNELRNTWLKDLLLDNSQ